jgi:hypothetical protein
VRTLTALSLLLARCDRAEGPAAPTGLHCPEGTREEQGVCVNDGWGVDGGIDAGDPRLDGGASCDEIVEAAVGAACETRCDCGADERWTCRTIHPSGGRIPGGYCVFDCSEGIDACPPGSVCFESVGQDCYDACERHEDCRTDEGYACLPAAGAFICWHP